MHTLNVSTITYVHTVRTTHINCTTGIKYVTRDAPIIVVNSPYRLLVKPMLIPADNCLANNMPIPADSSFVTTCIIQLYDCSEV